MIKPQHLRDHLADALPELKRDPDKLLVFIDQGSLAATYAPGLSFEYRYTLNLILTDFSGHPDSVMVPLLVWAAVNQPELLSNPANRGQISFEADVIANDKVDLDIKIQLTERVGVHARVGGGYDIEHYSEPQLEPNLQAGHWGLYIKGELVASWETPAI